MNQQKRRSAHRPMAILMRLASIEKTYGKAFADHVRDTRDPVDVFNGGPRYDAVSIPYEYVRWSGANLAAVVVEPTGL